MEKGYFQERLGYKCIDAGPVPGGLGRDLDGITLRKLRETNLLPVAKHVHRYSEDDLFEVIEFLYDHCSQPVKEDSAYHSWNDCGLASAMYQNTKAEELARPGSLTSGPSLARR